MLACRKKKRLFFAFLRRVKASAKRGRSARYALPRRACIALYAHFALAFTSLKKRRKKITHLPLPHWYCSWGKTELFNYSLFSLPSPLLLIFSMCTRRRFNILPRIWSPIIPESRSPISSCHFTSKEGQDPWFIHFRHATRLKLWKSCLLNIISRTFNWSQINNLNFRYRLQNCRFFFFAKIRTVLQSSLLVILFYQGVKQHFKIDLIFFSN